MVALRKLRGILVRTRRSLVALAVCAASVSICSADVRDPYDPLGSGLATLDESTDDDAKSATQLIDEAQNLLVFENTERPLDARTKLLKALQKDPKAYHAHMLLASYYMEHVGHFRLALKYVKQAENLFREKYGPPPYQDRSAQQDHYRLLYSLAQVRLNLDNYRGALETLDEISSYGYGGAWYPGSRAWVLMKLGRIDEAISVARLGAFAAPDGRTLNMLGILLSMSGDPQASLQVFKQAINYETLLGLDGKPATPLNNSGEVYKELFQEEKAEASWLRAKSLPDGCEHVLPSLNLALLYIDQANYAGAEKSIDTFEGCIAQFPLRNGEEHRALVHLARGRIALHLGRTAEALQHLEQTLENVQWFGKIGTSEDDLRAGALVSLAQALRAHNNHLRTTLYSSTREWLDSIKTIAVNGARSWWLMRRARQVLSEKLDDIEDLRIRHTDSLVEYPTLGEVLKGFPTGTLERRVAHERTTDTRPQAAPYYKAYLAERYLATWGRRDEGLALLREASSQLRERHDALLRVHLIMLQLGIEHQGSESYRKIANTAFSVSRAALRNYGHQLPVRFSGDPQIRDTLARGAFLIDDSEGPFSVAAQRQGEQFVLQFFSTDPSIGRVTVKGSDLITAVNRFTDAVFSGNGKEKE